MRAKFFFVVPALFAFLVSASSAWAVDVDVSVPELDPGSMASAMTLAVGGVLMLTERFRSK